MDIQILSLRSDVSEPDPVVNYNTLFYIQKRMIIFIFAITLAINLFHIFNILRLEKLCVNLHSIV